VINHRHICKCVFCGLASTTAHDVAVALALDVDMTFLVAARRDNVASLELEVANVVVLIFSRRYGREPLFAIGGLADKRGIPAQDHHGSMRTIVFDLFGEDLIRPAFADSTQIHTLSLPNASSTDRLRFVREVDLNLSPVHLCFGICEG